MVHWIGKVLEVVFGIVCFLALCVLVSMVVRCELNTTPSESLLQRASGFRGEFFLALVVLFVSSGLVNLGEYLKTYKEVKDRIEALDPVEDQGALAEIAKTDGEARVRRAAVEKLEDQRAE